MIEVFSRHRQVAALARPAVMAALLALTLAFSLLSYLRIHANAAESTPASSSTPTIPNFWDPSQRPVPSSANLRRIRFLASDDFPPFSFRDPAGRITGFNIDLARAICEELDVACTLRIKPFGELVDGLEKDEGDAIIAGLSTQDPAYAELAFTSSYLKFPARFVMRKAEVIAVTPESFADKWISVVEGSQHAAFAQRFFPDSHVATYRDAETARDALKDGQADAYFGDGLSLSFWLQGTESDGCCAFAEGTWIEPGYFDNALAIAVKPEAEDLRAALDYALQQIHSRGRFAELYLRYFPISFY